MFFRPTPYPGGNLVKTKMIHEPNSFADILKKIACNFIQPFSHSNYVLKVYRGGFVQPPPKTDQRGCPRGGGVIELARLALYDLYDVINDVINSKNRKFQKLLQITIFDRFWWFRMEMKADDLNFMKNIFSYFYGVYDVIKWRHQFFNIRLSLMTS